MTSVLERTWEEAMDDARKQAAFEMVQRWTVMILELDDPQDVRPDHRALVVTGGDLRRIEDAKLVRDLPEGCSEPWRFAFFFGESLLSEDRREEGVRDILKNLGEDLRSDDPERQARAAIMVYFLERFFDRAVIHGRGLEAAAMKKS